jgi:nucleotide-binding universal stress UspA family protein
VTSPVSAGSPLSSRHVRVVVGFDGSPNAEEALRWATEEAPLRRADLEVVSCWPMPLTITPAAKVMSGDVANLLESSARRAADDGVRLARLRGYQITVRPVVVRGQPGPSLVERADGTALLVVGRRGRGRGAELLLGSTSAYCLHHARCPIAVVPSSAQHGQHGAGVLQTSLCG